MLREKFTENIDALRVIMRETKNQNIAKRADDLLVALGQRLGDAEYIEAKLAQLTYAVATLEDDHANEMLKKPDTRGPVEVKEK